MHSDPWEWVANEHSDPWNCLMLGPWEGLQASVKGRGPRELPGLRGQCWQSRRRRCLEFADRTSDMFCLYWEKTVKSFRGVLISPRAENSQQDGRSWSKGCMALEQIWGDTPISRAKEKSQQDGKSKIVFRINPISDRDAQRAQTSLVHTRTQRPHRDWNRTVFECLLN